MFIETITYIVFLVCSKPKIINETTESWNITDERALKRAVKVCSTDPDYYDTPCLLRFYKREPLAYAAVCGAAVRKD